MSPKREIVLSVVWSENSTGPTPLASLVLHLFAAPADVAFWAANGAAKRGAEVADQAADAPIPDTAHTSGPRIPMPTAMANLNPPDQAASR